MSHSNPDDRQPTPREFDLVRSLGELLQRYMRDQDADLRTLALVSDAVEETEGRRARLVAELCSRFPHVDVDVAGRLVDEATTLYDEMVDGVDDDSDNVGFSDNLTSLVLSVLPPTPETVLLVGELMRMCIDRPDSDRMRGLVLIAAFASYEAFLLSVTRMVAVCNPSVAASKVPAEAPRLSRRIADLSATEAADLDARIDKLTRGGTDGSAPRSVDRGGQAARETCWVA